MTSAEFSVTNGSESGESDAGIKCKLLSELVGRAGLEPATNGLKDRVPIGPKYLTTMLLRSSDCGKQLPITGRKSTALLRTLLDFPHIRHCSREAASERENLVSS
jgi:hypothetical protein